MEYEQLRFIEKDTNEKKEEFVANIFRQLASNAHSHRERQKDDFYATDPLATLLLCEKEKFSSTVWEPCVGMGHIAEVLRQQGYEVVCSDIVYRGYPKTEIRNFLTAEINGGGGEQNGHHHEPPIQTWNTVRQESIGHICGRRKSCNVFENTVFRVARAVGTV